MFNVNLLNNQSGRYALIAEAILPPLFLFLIGGFFFARKMQENERVTFEGKPSPGAMWLLWFLVTCMWLIGLVIVAMDTLDTLSLCLIGIFSFLAIVASFVSMMFLSWDATMSTRINSTFCVLFAFGCMVATSAVTFGSQTPSDSKVVSGLFFALIAAWLGVATGYGYLGLNHKK